MKSAKSAPPSGVSLKILVLGVLTAGAVVALVVVATGGDDEDPRAGRALRPENKPRAALAESGETAAAEEAAAKPERPVDDARPQPAPTPRVAGPTAAPGGPQGVASPNPQPSRVPKVTPGASPQAMLELKDSYEAWMKTDENKFAKPESYGLDCRPPVCMLGAKYDSLQDGRFFDRSEAFFKARTDLGHLISFPHRMDERHSRTWFYYNPHEPGTAEHHEFNLEAIERIMEEKKDIPEYYPVPRPGYD